MDLRCFIAFLHTRYRFVCVCLLFESLQPGNVLKKKAAAKLYIERNLYEDFCRDGTTMLYY